jgi:hypothetical protein
VLSYCYSERFLRRAKDKEDIPTQEEKSASSSIEVRECNINTRSFLTTEIIRALKKKDETGAGNAMFR